MTDEAKQELLLPCAHCGSSCLYFAEGLISGCISARCEDCGMRTDWKDSEESATRAWNRRTKDAAKDDVDVERDEMFQNEPLLIRVLNARLNRLERWHGAMGERVEKLEQKSSEHGTLIVECEATENRIFDRIERLESTEECCNERDAAVGRLCERVAKLEGAVDEVYRQVFPHLDPRNAEAQKNGEYDAPKEGKRTKDVWVNFYEFAKPYLCESRAHADNVAEAMLMYCDSKRIACKHVVVTEGEGL